MRLPSFTSPPGRRRPALLRLLVGVAAAGLAVAVAVPTGADEGMWLFNQPPLAALEKEHGAKLTGAWLTHVQQASVRFSSGGSGSFVSADGLILTNHHVGADAIAKLGDERHDFMRDGFAAATRADELKCHDLELNVLVSIEDVTARVQGAVAAGMSPDEAAAARRRVMAEIEQESLAATGLRSDVVTLYQGGAYHLYRARKYTDVRLVFAPEKQIAFFGGDADNFEFPRYNLDVCFFRAYENGKPARVPHHLRWGAKPVAAGDLVFVSGHPGRTDRANTMAELLAMRDRGVPAVIQTLERLETTLGSYATEGPEEARQANDDLFGVQNNRKRQRGVLAGLLDPAILAAKQRAETMARGRYEAGLHGRPSAYARIEEAEAELAKIATRYRMLEAGQGFNSAFFTNARTLLRAAEERAKPNGERLREHRDSNRESLELRLLSAEPLYDEFEIVKLADSLTALVVAVGANDELVRGVLGGKSPRDRAAELVRGTTLGARPAAAGRPDARSDLLAGGAAAVAASTDPMIALARTIDAESRRLREIVEAAQEVKQQGHAEITRDRFAREGAAMYPDATFTLRLAFGTVTGYEEEGRTVTPITTYGGLFARAKEKRDAPPFDLPPRWSRLRPRLEADPDFLDTPFNFVCTADIIGGNSGSPVVNRAGELVGLIFDGNIHSLVTGIAYDPVRSRAVAVDASGIVAALRTVYGAVDLLAELAAGGGTAPLQAGSDGGGQPGVPAAAQASVDGEWRPLFDGTALGKWKPSDFGGGGEVSVVDGAIRIETGADLSGITWSGEFPRDDYEIALDARRVEGGDFFCGLTFPVGKDPCSFIVGGWGGGVVGLSSIDGEDAANNATTTVQEFKTGRWYGVQVRVTPERIVCFLDGRKVVDQRREGRMISIRESVAPSKPLGIATYATVGELKNIRWRPVDKGGPAEKTGDSKPR